MCNVYLYDMDISECADYNYEVFASTDTYYWVYAQIWPNSPVNGLHRWMHVDDADTVVTL